MWCGKHLAGMACLWVIFLLPGLTAGVGDVTTQAVMMMDDSQDPENGTIGDMLDFGDVQDWFMNATNITVNITTDNTNDTGISTMKTTRRPTTVNPECQWFKDNPYWRLSATKKLLQKYGCVCYNLCFTQEQLDYFQAVSKANNTGLGVWDAYQKPVFYATFVLFIAMIVFGTIANVVVIVGILGVMKDKTVVNRFVVSLAVADLFMALCITPLKLLYHVKIFEKLRWTWLCKILFYARQMAQTEAIVILTIIAFERYYAICHPLKAKFRCSMKRCHILICISWIISLIIALPTVIFTIYHEERALGAVCSVVYPNTRMIQFHYLYFLTLLLVVPTIIMSFAYCRICQVLWSSAKKATQLTNQKGKSDKGPPEIKARVKVIRTMIGLLVVFLVCWGPRLIFNAVAVYDVTILPSRRRDIDHMVEILANSHSLINPIMYIVLSQPLRTAYANWLPVWCCRGRLKRADVSKTSLASGQTLSSTDGTLKTADTSDISKHNHI